MAKVTGKLQVTIPKSLTQRCGISAGDRIVW
jgi:bifunctional DNA-binding transcriptional regulator/antitoxin component of YhaV-PrlF toxin-antitoxin module